MCTVKGSNCCMRSFILLSLSLSLVALCTWWCALANQVARRQKVFAKRLLSRWAKQGGVYHLSIYKKKMKRDDGEWWRKTRNLLSLCNRLDSYYHCRCRFLDIPIINDAVGETATGQNKTLYLRPHCESVDDEHVNTGIKSTSAVAPESIDDRPEAMPVVNESQKSCCTALRRSVERRGRNIDWCAFSLFHFAQPPPGWMESIQNTPANIQSKCENVSGEPLRDNHEGFGNLQTSSLSLSHSGSAVSIMLAESAIHHLSSWRA